MTSSVNRMQGTPQKLDDICSFSFFFFFFYTEKYIPRINDIKRKRDARYAPKMAKGSKLRTVTQKHTLAATSQHSQTSFPFTAFI